MRDGMTESVLPRPSRFPWLLPAGIFAVVLAILIAVVLFARESAKSEAPPQPPAFSAPASLPYIAYDVERSEGGRLQVSTGNARDVTSSELVLAPGTSVWLFDVATAADLQPPLLVNVIAIPNEVRNYTIKTMAFAPPQGTVTFEEPFLALADGFFGHETSRDQKERVVASSLLETFDGRNGVTKTSTGPGTLYVDEGAPIRLLRTGEPTEIEPGDRIALHPDANGNPDPAQGVFVLVGGAR